MEYLALQLLDIGIVDRLSDHFVQSGFFRILSGHGLQCAVIGDCFYLSHNTGVMRRSDLRAVLPVYFVAIIFRRIVACGNVDSRNAAQLSYCVGKFRSRT